MDKTSTESTITSDTLSKAIDDLITKEFGDELNKGNLQPKNDIDQLPKDTDVIANGGKDIYKAHTKEYDKMNDDEKEKYDENMKSRYGKAVKKSEQDSSENVDNLIKSLGQEKEKNQQLIQSSEDFNKSFFSLQENINEKFENIGEIFKGLKYEVDTIKKTPLPRQSIKDITEIHKSFTDGGGDGDPPSPPSTQPFLKAEVEAAIEDLVKANKVPIELLTEFEMYSKFQNPHQGKMVSTQIMVNRKKK